MLKRVNPLFWLAVTAALILGSERSVQAGQTKVPADGKSCQMKKLTSLDVRSIGAGRFLVPVRIAGHDVWMSLALEEGIVALYGAAIADWHLNTIRMANGSRRIMFMGKPITDMVREDFSLGSQGFQSWPMIVVPPSAIPAVNSFEGKPVVGQLAARFLTAVDAEINLAQNNITLFEQVKCGSAAAYWGGTVTAIHFEFDQTGLLHFPMQLEQQEIQTSFDTSSRYSRISTEVTKKFFGFDEQSPGLQSETRANGTRSHSYRAMALTAAGLDIKDARVELWPTQSCRPDRSLSRLNGIGCQDVYGITPFAIGTDLLKQLHIYIASKEHMVYFTRVDPSAPVTAVGAGAPAG
jgi:hypothetical protein